MSGEIDPLFANHPEILARKRQTRAFISSFKETNPMSEDERNKLTDAAIELLISKDGDRDHMNHSDITCEQSMAIVELLRSWRRSGANLGEILRHTVEPRTAAGSLD